MPTRVLVMFSLFGTRTESAEWRAARNNLSKSKINKRRFRDLSQILRVAGEILESKQTFVLSSRRCYDADGNQLPEAGRHADCASNIAFPSSN